MLVFDCSPEPFNKDIIVDKSMYDTLPDDWRVPDTLGNGNPAHTWQFKQLHVMLDSVPSDFQRVVDHHHLVDTGGLGGPVGPNEYINYPTGDDGGAITTYTHPDFLVDDSTDVNIKHAPILEIRLLSTYRDTVRVRSMSLEDTTTDKFLYRKIDTGTHKSYSCEPNGKKGGFDSVVATIMKEESDSAAAAHRQYELYYNDTYAKFHRFSQPMIAYLDYVGGQYGLNTHIHEQDFNDGFSLFWRRERRSFDGIPPSLFENEGYPAVRPDTAMPVDYIYYADTVSKITGSWPSAADTRMGLWYTRKTTGSDSMSSYHAFDTLFNGAEFLQNEIRISVKNSENHPKNKRTAVEANIPAWGQLNNKYTNPSWDTHIGFP